MLLASSASNVSASDVISATVDEGSTLTVPLLSRCTLLCVPMAIATDIEPSSVTPSSADGNLLMNVRTVEMIRPSRWTAIVTGYRPVRGMLSASGRTSMVSSGIEMLY